MYIDRKETVWYRYRIDKEEHEVGNLFEDKIINLMAESDHGEYMFDTGEGIEPHENGGFATIEVYRDDGKILWANGKH